MSVEKLQAQFTPDCWGDHFPEGYGSIVRLYGEVVAQLMLGEYQGDMLYVIRDQSTGLFAYLHTGYGSCSGCDQIQSIDMRLGWDVKESTEAWQELAEFVEELRPTQWMSGLDLLAWLREHDWQGDWMSGETPEIMKWIEDEVAPKLTA